MQRCSKADYFAEGFHGRAVREGTNSEQEELGYSSGAVNIHCLVSSININHKFLLRFIVPYI